jgi:hypothetical protein
VPALADQVQVHFTHGGKVAVGLVHHHWLGTRVGNFQPVVGNMTRLHWLKHRSPDPVRLVRHGHGTGGGDDVHGISKVLYGPDGHVAVVVQVCTQDGVRRVMLTVRHLAEGIWVHVKRRMRPISTC